MHSAQARVNTVMHARIKAHKYAENTRMQTHKHACISVRSWSRPTLAALVGAAGGLPVCPGVLVSTAGATRLAIAGAAPTVPIAGAAPHLGQAALAVRLCLR